MNQITLKRAVYLLALAGLTFTYASAKEPAENEEKLSSKIKPAGAQAHAEENAIPECLERLKLTAPQQTQVKEILGKYDVKTDAVWKQFGERYMQTIKTEVALLAAIEDTMTDAQRTKVRDQRRKTAHAEPGLEGKTDKLHQAKGKPVDAVKEELDASGVSLNAEQEAAADKIHEKYLGQLRSLNRDIQGLHTRLVSLEADKLVEIEKTLTKEQLAQLREGRLNVPAGAKVTSSTKSSKTE